MKKKENLFIVISIVFFLIGAFFCTKAMNSTKTSASRESSSVDYTVCLKENAYYKDTCLSEGREYLASLTDTIRINYNYSNISVLKNKVEYYIGTNLKISNRDNGKEIYNNDNVLGEKKTINKEKNVLNIVESVDIKYKDYENLVSKYTYDYELNTSSILQVYLKIVDGKKERIVSSVEIPIKEQTYSITKTGLSDNNNTINENYKSELLLGIVAITVSIAIIVVKLLKNRESNLSDFEQEVQRLLTEYDRIIVETKLESLQLTGKELIEINDFMELVDVRDTIEKPIMYFRRNDAVRDFIVQDKEIIYRYRMIDKENYSEAIEDPVITKIENNKNKETGAKEIDHFHTKTIEIPILKDVNEKGEENNES